MSNIQKMKKRQSRVRFHLKAVSSRPRLSVFRSNLHIAASIIDDSKNATITTVSDQSFKGTKTERAQKVGEKIAEAALKLGIKQVVYDRGSFRYHGRVKALAEAARAKGLEL